MNRRLMILFSTAALLAAAILPAAAAPLAGPCAAGGAYDPACDVNQNGVIDVLDIQLTAGHWNQNGVFTSGSWDLTGNAGTNPATNFVGTTDNQPLEIKVNGQRTLLIAPTSNAAFGPSITAGHSSNSISAGVDSAIISGGGLPGFPNQISADGGAIGGGAANQVSGLYAAIPGGRANSASGDYSFAAGRRAKANNAGAFVLADSNDFDLSPGVNNALTARFTGGARFILGINAAGAATWLCAVYNGGSWGCSSDRNVKENFQPVDGQEVLEKLMTVPITTWNAIGADPAVRRMGPMAQDFSAAFGLGDDDKVITTGDLDGVALASIQGLYQIVQEQDAQIVALQQENADLQARLAAIERALGIGQ